MTREPPRLGLRANARQFSLLVVLNAFVGAMVGLERTVLPSLGEEEFGLASSSAVLSFVAAFGIAKALTNLAAGRLADTVGRRRLLAAGWLLGVPVPVMIALAPGWWLVVVANLLLGVNQGLAWSMTVLMKIDLVGPARRGLALGLNESAGYLGVAATALLTGLLAGSFAPRTVVWTGLAVVACVGTLLTLGFVRDTAQHVAHEQSLVDGGAGAGSLAGAAAGRSTPGGPRGVVLPGGVQAGGVQAGGVLRACSQAGFVNNLNDALAWGLAPLYLAANGATASRIGIVAAAYPAVWGAGQAVTGWLSDHVGRKPLITAGMLVQAGALGVLVASGGGFALALLAAVVLGVGTAMVYPTLIASVSDAVSPMARARAVGAYRFWRDAGFVAGAFVAGGVTDALGMSAAIVLVAAVTGASGLWVAATRFQPLTRAPTVPHTHHEPLATLDSSEKDIGSGPPTSSPRDRV